jgi:hypothetical protein
MNQQPHITSAQKQGVPAAFLERDRKAVIGLICAMAKKTKDRLRVHKEARRLARRGVGMPPTERTIPDKRRKPVKHKKQILELEPD